LWDFKLSIDMCVCVLKLLLPWDKFFYQKIYV